MAEFHDADWWRVELERMIEEQIPEELHLDYKEKVASFQPLEEAVGQTSKRGPRILARTSRRS